MFTRVEKRGAVTIVNIQLTQGTAGKADAVKNELFRITDMGQKYIVTDLSQIEFIDSSFLGALVKGLKYAMENNGDLRVCGLNPSVKTMFELTKLDNIFKVYKTREDAIASFS